MKFNLPAALSRLMVVLSVCIALFFSSCVDYKRSIYFNNVRDTTFAAGSDVQAIIQKNDFLSITVSSLNPEATLIFNTANMAVSAPTSNSIPGVGTITAGSQSSGYLVNQEGNIQFPVLGYLQAAGLTKKQLTDKISQTLDKKKLLIDPIVNIRFLNFRVTVLGEVARPTVINVANEKISILEAIGLAGDLTIFAKRDNVLLIREENGEKKTHRINLNSSETLTSPYYYLRTNDIIYAEPTNARLAAASSTRQNLPIVLSALSFLTIIFTYVLRRN